MSLADDAGNQVAEPEVEPGFITGPNQGYYIQPDAEQAAHEQIAAYEAFNDKLPDVPILYINDNPDAPPTGRLYTHPPYPNIGQPLTNYEDYPQPPNPLVPNMLPITTHAASLMPNPLSIMNRYPGPFGPNAPISTNDTGPFLYNDRYLVQPQLQRSVALRRYTATRPLNDLRELRYLQEPNRPSPYDTRTTFYMNMMRLRNLFPDFSEESLLTVLERFKGNLTASIDSILASRRHMNMQNDIYNYRSAFNWRQNIRTTHAGNTRGRPYVHSNRPNTRPRVQVMANLMELPVQDELFLPSLHPQNFMPPDINLNMGLTNLYAQPNMIRRQMVQSQPPNPAVTYPNTQLDPVTRQQFVQDGPQVNVDHNALQQNLQPDDLTGPVLHLNRYPLPDLANSGHVDPAPEYPPDLVPENVRLARRNFQASIRASASANVRQKSNKPPANGQNCTQIDSGHVTQEEVQQRAVSNENPQKEVSSNNRIFQTGGNRSDLSNASNQNKRIASQRRRNNNHEKSSTRKEPNIPPTESIYPTYLTRNQIQRLNQIFLDNQ